MSWTRVEIRRPGSGERKIGYFPWLASCRLIQLNTRVWWDREKCLVQPLGTGICPESILDCGSEIKLTVKFTIWQC